MHRCMCIMQTTSAKRRFSMHAPFSLVAMLRPCRMDSQLDHMLTTLSTCESSRSSATQLSMFNILQVLVPLMGVANGWTLYHASL